MAAKLRQSVSLLALLAIASCADETTEKIVTDTVLAASVVYRDDYCSETQPAILLLSREASWNDWNGPAESNSAAPEKPADQQSNVDFDSRYVIVIAMGEKPSSGYSVGLSPAANAVVVREDILTIESMWRQPGDDDVVAQVITSPCLAIEIPKAEFNVVRVMDEFGNILLQESIQGG